MRQIMVLCATALLAAWCGDAQQRDLRPGINFFSKDQDVQLGQEAASEIEKKIELVNNREVNEYIERIGRRLASRPEADKYPYTFKVVNDKAINAFALPGGPIYVNTGLILAAQNEAQLAGVLAHEISHIALRHSTNQVTKANLIRLPAMLAGAAVGADSLLGQLSQLGVGLGANSRILKFSRGAERDADLLGTRMMSGAGYNPVEMAHFFEKLEAEGGPRGLEFFASHPNPGNRVKAVQAEIRYLPAARYNADEEPHGKASMMESRPSDQFLSYRSRDFELSYPDNWRLHGDLTAAGVTIAPPSALEKLPNGGTSVAYGAIVSYYYPEGRRVRLDRATDELVERLKSANPSMRVGEQGSQRIRVDGKRGLLTILYSDSHFEGEIEVDKLITVARPQGLFYIVFVVPAQEMPYAAPAFEKILGSVRFIG